MIIKAEVLKMQKNWMSGIYGRMQLIWDLCLSLSHIHKNKVKICEKNKNCFLISGHRIIEWLGSELMVANYILKRKDVRLNLYIHTINLITILNSHFKSDDRLLRSLCILDVWTPAKYLWSVSTMILDKLYRHEQSSGKQF